MSSDMEKMFLFYFFNVWIFHKFPPKAWLLNVFCLAIAGVRLLIGHYINQANVNMEYPGQV
jgi:hypothetical protein